METLVDNLVDDMYEIVVIVRGTQEEVKEIAEVIESSVDAHVMRHGGELIGVFNATQIRKDESK